LLTLKFEKDTMRALYLLREGRTENSREAIQKALFLCQDHESGRIEALIVALEGVLAVIPIKENSDTD